MFESVSGFIRAAEKIPLDLKDASEEKGESSDSQRSGPKVLVVDDHKLIADTLCEILRGAGFRVMAAYDGWDAMSAAAGYMPEYLLSDVLMPRMNGVDLAIAIRKMYPATKILLFSGQAGISEILLEGQKQGYEFEIISKPIHPLKLIEHLKSKE
jgi:CheY-like chemotaxis protein